MENKIRLNKKQKIFLWKKLTMDSIYDKKYKEKLFKEDWFIIKLHENSYNWRFETKHHLFDLIGQHIVDKLLKMTNKPKTNAFIVDVDYESSTLIMQNILDDEDFEKYKNKHKELEEILNANGLKREYDLVYEEMAEMTKLYRDDLIIITSDLDINIESGFKNIERITIV